MMESASNWSELYSELKKTHDDAYFIIEKAIKLEEEGRHDDAFAKYENGLILLDKALSTPIECPSNPDMTWEKACVMVQKMKKTRKEVLCRIADAQSSAEPVQAPPPSYEEATSGSTTPQPLVTYQDLAAALQDLKVETGAQTAEILYTQDNVRVYFISPDGTVSAPSQPETLKIVQLGDEGGNNPKAFLQVGFWIYPLVPGVSPCYRTEHNAFILPDVHSPIEGSSVALILPDDADETVFELLEDILLGIVTRTPVPPPRARQRRAAAPGEGYTYSFSRGLVRGAHYISNGLIQGAEKAGQMMNYGTPKLIEKINPDPVPRPVNPSVTRGIEVAKNVTGTAVQITGYVASKIGTATMALGRYLAPHIQRQGTRLLSRTCSLSEEEASKKMDGVLEVAAGAVEGFGTVYNGLEKSAGILATSLANNTVKVVEHKYGHPVGEATGNTFNAMGNVFVAGMNIKHLTPKGIAKVTAKSTAKAVVEDYRKSLQDEKGDDKHNGPGPSSAMV